MLEKNNFSAYNKQNKFWCTIKLLISQGDSKNKKKTCRYRR